MAKAAAAFVAAEAERQYARARQIVWLSAGGRTLRVMFDGHTASLVPGDPVLNVTDVDVAITGLYQNRRRMTMTYPVINRACRVLWLVTGKDKAEMVGRLCAGDTSIPAGRVQKDRALVLADCAAADPDHIPAKKE